MSNIILEKCSICAKLMSKNALILHSKLHNANNQTYYCIHPLCLQTYFDTEFQLAEHYKFYHQLSDSIAKDIVKRQLTNEDEKDDHIAAKLSEIAEPPRLTVLDPVPPNDASLSIETNQIESTPSPAQKSRSRPCEICKVATKNYWRHMNSVHNSNRPFKCERGCIRTYFTTLRMKKVHTTMHHSTPNRKFHLLSKTVVNKQVSKLPKPQKQKLQPPCSICGKYYRNNMTKHMWTHIPIGRPFKCTKGCIRIFWKTKSLLKKHYDQCHNESMKIRLSTTSTLSLENVPEKSTPKFGLRRLKVSACKICGRRMIDQVMHNHMAVHNHVGRPFQCNRGCVRTFFINKNRLNSHYLTIHKNRTTNSEKASADISSTIIADCASSPAPTRSLSKTASKFKPCDICGKNVVGGHMATHNPVGRRYQCTRGCVSVFFTTKKCREFHNRLQHGVVKKINPTVLKPARNKPTKNQPARKQPTRNQPAQNQLTKSEPARNQPVENQSARNQPTGDQPTIDPPDADQPARNEPTMNQSTETQQEVTKPFSIVNAANLCSICGKRSGGGHMATHNPEGRPFKCSKGCVEIYCRTQAGLNTHYWTYHKMDKNDNVEDKLAKHLEAAKTITQCSSSVDKKLPDLKSQIDVASPANQPSASSTAKLEIENNEIENKRRRESVTAMILNLPATASEFEKKTLLDLYRICKS